MSLESIRERWGFPEVVNATAARVVAALVALTAIGVVASGAHALLPVVALGFLLRVLSGPKLSPYALLATRVIVPRLKLPVIPVPGAPKRFAQAVGLAFTLGASALAFAGHARGADALLGVLALFATLEASVEFCAGCWVYEQLVRRGLLPPLPDVSAPDPEAVPVRR